MSQTLSRSPGRLAMILSALAITVVTFGSLGCDDDDNNGSSGTPQPTKTAKPTNTTRPTNTPTLAGQATNTPAPRTSTPTRTATARVDVGGNYSAAIPLDNGRTAHLNLTVQEDGDATGTLEIVENQSGLTRSGLSSVISAISVSLGFANISGDINVSNGSFHFSGNISIAGTSTSFDLSGNLPLSGGSGSVTAVVNGRSFTASIGMGSGPTPLPTQGGPTPTPPVVGGCAHGVFNATTSNASGTNARLPIPTLGKVTAIDAADGVGGFVWTITANECTTELGAISHGLVISGSGIPTRIQAGTYTLNSLTPPFLGVAYNDLFLVTNPAERLLHGWNSNGGTLVLTNAGGGGFNVHITATMTPSTFITGGVGDFTLDVTGTISSIGI